MPNKDEVNSKAEDSPLGVESVLESLGADFTVVDLNWSPEKELDWSPEDVEKNEDAEAENEEELEKKDPNQLLLHTLATMSKSAIEDLNHDDPYETVQWDEDLAERYLCIVPTQIHPIATGSGMYLRFWGYLCEFDPETESISGRRVTMSLPSKLTRWMGAGPESFSMKADPVDDAVVFMLITQYYGREEFEIDGQMRSAHGFGAIDLIEGRWHED